MRPFAIILVALIGCTGPGSAGRDSAGVAVTSTDTALRRGLLARLETDQAARAVMMAKMQRGESPDSMDVERIIVVGLPPLAQYIRMVDPLYTPPPPS